MKLNDVQKRLLSQKQVKKPHMMKGGKLPKAQMGTIEMLRKNPRIRIPNPSPPPQIGRFNPYQHMDSTALADVYQDLYGDMTFMNTGLEGESYSDIENQIMQKFIDSQGTYNPRMEFRVREDLLPTFPKRGSSTISPLSKKKGGRIKGSGSNGVL